MLPNFKIVWCLIMIDKIINHVWCWITEILIMFDGVSIISLLEHASPSGIFKSLSLGILHSFFPPTCTVACINACITQCCIVLCVLLGCPNYLSNTIYNCFKLSETLLDNWILIATYHGHGSNDLLNDLKNIPITCSRHNILYQWLWTFLSYVMFSKHLITQSF